MILSCKDIKIEFGANTVLENVTFLVEEGEKTALVGVNGAGKTTLLKIITGELAQSSGEITVKKDTKLGYLAQMKDLEQENTITEELLSVFSELVETETRMRETEQLMSGLNGDELMAALEKYSRLTHYFEDNGGFEYQSRIRGVIAGLGFSKEEADMKIKILSGGQKTRVSLGKLLLSAPDILLLDEPTNHLDIESVSWLEDVFLSGYKGSVIVVSHDRYFIDKTCTKIIEIENGKSKVYNGNYTFFALKKEADREIELKHYLDVQKEVKRQEEVIKLLRSFNREKSIRRAESREKLLAKMDKPDKPERLPEKIRIVLEPKIMSGYDVFFAEGMKKSFGDFVLFENADIDIKRGEIVALIGANGIGKTTLFKMILGMSACDRGYMRKGTNVSIGYYDQEHAALDEDKTIFAELSDTYPKLKDLEIRNVLASFVFFGDDVFKQIFALSGGEKGRVALAKLMLGGYNFLMLDEPTNHLDMFSKEILEEALRNYAGTVFYISHDRYFINNTASKILELNRDRIVSYDGDYEYYCERRRQERADTVKDVSVTASKEEREQKKERQSNARRRQTKLERLFSDIEALEEKIKECDELLQTEEVFTNHVRSKEIFSEKTKFEQKHDELYTEWLELYEED